MFATQMSQQTTFFPKSDAGWLAIALLGAHALFVSLFLGLVMSGEEGGDTFFANPWLAWTALPAAVFGIGSGLMAAYAVIKRRERAILDYVVLLFALGVAVFILTEIAFPH